MNEKIEFVRGMMRSPQRMTLPPSARIPASLLECRNPPPGLKEAGEQLLRDGKIAVLMVAGGVSARMGGSGLRGNIPIGPVSGRSIFRLQGEKIAAMRVRYALHMPWLVMTSREVHEDTVRSFQREEYFGVAPDDIWFFEQSSLPVLDENLDPVRTEDGGCLCSPAGHGGMLQALGASGLVERLRNRGIVHLFYFQYANLLERICDPVALGYHHLNASEATTKVFRECWPGERVGRVVAFPEGPDGERHQVVEYYFAKDVEVNLPWDALPASAGTHIWDVSFLARVLREDVQLPYHRVPHHSPDRESPLWKLEQFVFDLLPHAHRTALAVISKDDEYAVAKYPTGRDSVHTARAALLNLYRGWLDEAGAVPKGPDDRVEISPLYALDPDDLAEKLPHGYRYGDGLILQ